MKKYHKNEWHLLLMAHIFTKLSQNMSLINTHILIYQNDRCDCNLWNTFGFYCVFWVFSCIIWRPFMSELLYLPQTFTDYASNQYTHIYMSTYQMGLQIMERPLILLLFFWVFSYIIDDHSCQKCYIFTVCVSKHPNFS